MLGIDGTSQASAIPLPSWTANRTIAVTDCFLVTYALSERPGKRPNELVMVPFQRIRHGAYTCSASGRRGPPGSCTTGYPLFLCDLAFLLARPRGENGGAGRPPRSHLWAEPFRHIRSTRLQVSRGKLRNQPVSFRHIEPPRWRFDKFVVGANHKGRMYC